MIISVKHIPKTVTFEITLEDVEIKQLDKAIYELLNSQLKVDNRYEEAIEFLTVVQENLNPKTETDGD